MKRPIFFFFYAMIIGAGLGFAQTKVDQGKPGTQGSWPVTFSGPSFPADGGFPAGSTVVNDIPYQCGAASAQAVTRMDGGSNIVGALNPRLYIVVCNSKDNTTGDIRCRADGVPVITTGSPGTVLGIGDCVPFTNPGGLPVRCIGGSNYVSTYECAP